MFSHVYPFWTIPMYPPCWDKTNLSQLPASVLVRLSSHASYRARIRRHGPLMAEHTHPSKAHPKKKRSWESESILFARSVVPHSPIVRQGVVFVRQVQDRITVDMSYEFIWYIGISEVNGVNQIIIAHGVHHRTSSPRFGRLNTTTNCDWRVLNMIISQQLMFIEVIWLVV